MLVQSTLPYLFHLGAAQEVTGSCHFLDLNGLKILIDCGMFQENKGRNKNFTLPQGISPKDIDVVILTHGHLDHCGKIPQLYKQGFSGKVLCTAPTKDISEVMFEDTLKIFSKGKKKESGLFTSKHAQKALQGFDRVLYGKKTDLGRNVGVTFYNASHMLGSAFIVVEYGQGECKKQIVFSGDLGNSRKSFLPPMELPDGVHPHTIVCESTYGSRIHEPFEDGKRKLYDAINRTIGRGGRVIIPTFAVERAQELMDVINHGIKEGEITSSPLIVLDSPMAVSATEFFLKYPEFLNNGFAGMFDDEKAKIQLVDSSQESMALNDVTENCIILSCSASCDQGRIVHHLKKSLSNEKDTIIFPGFTPMGSLARKIMEAKDGNSTVKIRSKPVSVKAEIVEINGAFSGHADQSDLIRWVKHFSGDHLRLVSLVHGAKESAESLRSALQACSLNSGLSIEIPEPRNIITLPA